jgi:hypothetical protein
LLHVLLPRYQRSLGAGLHLSQLSHFQGPAQSFTVNLGKGTHMTTGYKIMTSLAFSAAFLAAIAVMPAARAQMGTSGAVVVTNGPQIDPGDRSGSWSAQQNVRDSERYEAVVHANSSFRANRISKECGPINDPQLHANCVASFGQ